MTAQRRSENLQTIPLAVTTVSGTELLNQGISDTASLSLGVAGLSYTQGANAATPFIAFHGGRIWAVPNVPHGATIQFTLPLHLGASG